MFDAQVAGRVGLDELDAVIDGLDPPRDPASVRRLLAAVDRLTAKAHAALGQLDADGAWATDGSLSLQAWIRASGRAGGGAAARMARTTGMLRSLPVTRRAWEDGRLSTDHVVTIVAHLDPLTVPLFADHEPLVIPSLEGLDPRATHRAMEHWRAHADALVDRPEPPAPESSVTVVGVHGGRVDLRADLAPYLGEVVRTAIRLATRTDAEGERRAPSQRKADAVGDIVRFYLDHHPTPPGTRQRPHLNLVADATTVHDARDVRIGGGPVLDRATAGALLCDCAVHRVLVTGRSTILDYGTATRTAPAGLFNALVLRDQACTHPGCGLGPEYCDAHHVHWWEHGGPTTLDNLRLVCWRHHQLVHGPGWTEWMEPDGTVHLTTPDGIELVHRPPGILPTLPLLTLPATGGAGGAVVWPDTPGTPGTPAAPVTPEAAESGERAASATPPFAASPDPSTDPPAGPPTAGLAPPEAAGPRGNDHTLRTTAEPPDRPP